jgi:cytidylate kinase
MAELFRINILGKACSGKSEVTKHLTQNLGFDLYRPSDTIRNYARERGLALHGREDYVAAHAAIFNEDPFAMIRPILESPAERLCIDGLRTPRMITRLRREIGMVTLALEAPVDVRFARRLAAAQERVGRDASEITTLEAFIADEAADDAPGQEHLCAVTAAMELADHAIDAVRPAEAVIDDVESYLVSLGRVAMPASR